MSVEIMVDVLAANGWLVKEAGQDYQSRGKSIKALPLWLCEVIRIKDCNEVIGAGPSLAAAIEDAINEIERVSIDPIRSAPS